jgi:hypothetical protein
MTFAPERTGSATVRVLPCRIQVFSFPAHVLNPQRLYRHQALNCCSLRFRFADRVSSWDATLSRFDRSARYVRCPKPYIPFCCNLVCYPNILSTYNMIICIKVLLLWPYQFCTVGGTEICITSWFRLYIPFVKLYFDHIMQTYDNMHIICVTESTTGLTWDFGCSEICLY